MKLRNNARTQLAVFRVRRSPPAALHAPAWIRPPPAEIPQPLGQQAIAIAVSVASSIAINRWVAQRVFPRPSTRPFRDLSPAVGSLLSTAAPSPDHWQRCSAQQRCTAFALPLCMLQSGGKLPYTDNLDDTFARKKQKSSLVFKERDLISADLNILRLWGFSAPGII